MPFTASAAVSPLVSLGAAPLGERRYVPWPGGVRGPGLSGRILEGGVDW